MTTIIRKAACQIVLCVIGCIITWQQAYSQGQEDETRSRLRYGGDFRLRQETMDEIASPSKVIDDNYLRTRTRLWMEYDPIENVTLRVRAINEFRHWFRPDQTGVSESANYEWPDELVFDNIYLDSHDLLGGALSVRIGRQDFMVDGTDKPLYGKGKVIYDGTSEDGSRTRYFNGLRISWKMEKNTSLDVFGVYMPPEDDLAVSSVDRDLTGYTSASDDMTQAGAGLYLKNKTAAACPFEAYAIYKHDETWTQVAKKNAAGEWIQPGYAWQTLDTSAKVIENAERDLYTVGVYLAPKFGKSTRGTLEVACQVGQRGDADVSGFMVDAVLTQDLPLFESAKPAVEAEFYYLSGDDASTDRDEGWDPVCARYTQHSEVLLRTFARARWSNLTMPMLYVCVTPSKRLTGRLGVSYVMAPEDDGAGNGKDRGWWYFVRSEYTVVESWLRTGDQLTARLWAETLCCGNYYEQDDTAYFMQWQMVYKF